MPRHATPATIDEAAPVVVRLSTTVDAPLARVWALHTNVDAWPIWHPDVEKAELAGPLSPGSSFRWLTHGLDITSTVLELVPYRRIVWGGPAQGIDGIHVWTFEEVDGAVRVHTEESWSGAPVEDQAERLRAALHSSLERWLQYLGATAERRP
ncbi:SRPBCC family protein [Kitasatospora sp. NBC_00374]|uniref:SRPBCC family protein n=1 Tax=Kitasatospora sp. NBC_00374 TaxID=2975964 RepID=UPI00324EEC8A